MMSAFLDVFEDVTKCGTKIPSNQYLPIGKYPIIDQGQEVVAGYTNQEDGLFENVPAIIFGDHTRVIKYVDKPCFLGADGVKLLKAKDCKSNYKYLYYVLSNAKIPDTGYNRHFKWLKEIDILLYDEETQINIVKELDKITDLIDKRKEQLKKLDELVKARFVELFGDPTDIRLNRVPLIEYVENTKYGTSQPPQFDENGCFKFIRATNIKNGHITEKDMLFISKAESEKISKCKLNGGELIIVRSGANTGDTCVITDEYKGQYAGYDIIVTLKTDKLNPVFLNELINIPQYMKTVVKPLTARSAQPHLNTQQVQSLPILVVGIDKQNEFAAFVEQTDKSKLEVQKSLEKLELLKKALMQKYFG